MDWGDVPALAAVVVAVAAAVVSGIALKHSRDSVQAAKQSAVAADRSAVAAERSAAADAAKLAEMRREAQERRDAEAEAARPRPELRVEHVGDVLCILRNYGTGPAVDVVTVRAGLLGQCTNVPNGVTIGPRWGPRIRRAHHCGDVSADGHSRDVGRAGNARCAARAS